jgi:alkanesulfonate monooxygenase SsuD/methylene tetrahydromethanopterin reductase-like flavin-dependent oxidoreductase (luciferase family)
MVEPQEGLAYEQLLHIARRALDLGLEGTFRSDHYQGLSGQVSDEPATDAWATLAGLVRDLHDGVVGTLVSPVTFRSAGQLAKVVATVSHMSNGPRVELGLGAGWNEAEHKAYGFPFGSFDDRFRVLEEYLPVVRGILSGDAFSFGGEHITIDGNKNRPAGEGVRIIVGGGGPRRTPRLAARYADELNVVMMGPAPVAERVQATVEFLEAEGRRPEDFCFSWMGPFVIGATAAEVEERAARLGSARGASAEQVLGRMRGGAAVGTVSQAAEFLESLGEVGVSRVMLQHLLTDDDEHLALAAEAAAEANVS